MHPCINGLIRIQKTDLLDSDLAVFYDVSVVAVPHQAETQTPIDKDI